MAKTFLDQLVVFAPRVQLSAEQAEWFRGVPGVIITRAGAVLCPVNAYSIVLELVQALGIPASVSLPKVPMVDAGASLRRLAASGEMRAAVDDVPLLTQWLKPFQQEAITFAIQRDSALIWSSAGSGKTVMSIVWALATPGAVLVVTKGGARFQWAGEVRRFTRLTPYVWKPASAMRKKDLTLDQYMEKLGGDRPVVVVGWEMLAEIKDQLASVVRPTSIVFDEIHRGKASRRKKWAEDEEGNLQGTDLGNMSSAAFSLAERAQRRLGTTATPIMDRLPDLWGQMTLIEPRSWGKTATRFLQRYCGATQGDFGGIKAQGVTNLDELQRRLGYAVHQVPYATSHGQLPEKRRRVTTIPVDQQVKPDGFGAMTREMAGLCKAIARAEEEGSSTARAVLDRLTELRIMEACSRKRAAVVDKVIEAMDTTAEKRKVIVFSGRREDVEQLARAIEKRLDKAGINAPVYVGHGEIPAEDREEIRQKYMADKAAVLIGTYQSFGESLNLHDTDYCLVAMLPYRPGEYEQLEGRVHRLGMNRSVLIEYLIAERTADERVKYLLLDKLPAVDRLSSGLSALDGLSTALAGREHHDAEIAGLVSSIASWSMDDTDLDD